MKPPPKKLLPVLATAGLLIVLFGGASLAFRGFCSPFVAADLVNENAFLGIAALGATLVILSGGIDLSVGSVIGFTTILVATLVTERGVPPVVAWAAALAIGSAFGCLMGLLIHAFELPAFLVTLSGLFLARGAAFAVRSESVTIDHPLYRSLSEIEAPIGGGAAISFSAVVFLALFAAAVFVAHGTRFGRNVYAIGGGPESAVMMGLPVARTRVGVYTLSGFCSALAGVAMTLYTNSGNPAAAAGLELDAIAVVVIGGVVLTGGVGYVAGTLLGLLVYTTAYQITYFANLPSSLATITIGVLLLAFILLQRVINRTAAAD